MATFFYDSGVSLQSIRDYLGHDCEEMTEQYIDYMPRKIAAANTEFFGKPGNSLASCLKKGGRVSARSIKVQRENRGWTLGKVAEKVGITKQSISAIENGEVYPSYKTLCKLEN